MEICSLGHPAGAQGDPEETQRELRRAQGYLEMPRRAWGNYVALRRKGQALNGTGTCAYIYIYIYTHTYIYICIHLLF